MKIQSFPKIAFSQFDKKNKVKIPELNDELLAYETGVHLGDGSLQIIPGGTHLTRYYGNREEDWIFVSEILPRILKELFNKTVSANKYPDKCCLSVCSKAVATFKHNVLGLPNGNKMQLQSLPSFVKKNKQLLTSCLRGLADTDFGLYFHNNGYPGLICAMSNKGLINDIFVALQELGFTVKIRFDVERIRNGKVNIEHVIKLYGKKNLEKWVHIIGFWNPKHMTKYLVWKKLGFSKNKTTIQERISMLQRAGISFNPKRRPRRWG